MHLTTRPDAAVVLNLDMEMGYGHGTMIIPTLTCQCHSGESEVRTPSYPIHTSVGRYACASLYMEHVHVRGKSRVRVSSNALL